MDVEESGTAEKRSVAWTAGTAALLLALVCVGLWIADLAGWAPFDGEPWKGPGLVQGLALTAFMAASALWTGLRFAAAVAAGGRRRRRALALAAILAVALAVRLTGLDHELVDRPYLDEGTYWTHAQEINRGQPWSASFVYPHFVYYADAFTLWAARPFRPFLEGGVAAVLGREHPAASGGVAFDWLLLRLLVALAGAFTVWPVFRIAEMVAGRGDPRAGGREGTAGSEPAEGSPLGSGLAAGVMGGLLIAFAPLYNEIAHLNISDLPSAFFATLCLAACAGLLGRESLPGYLAAGATSGLAAACKYPAGVVAVAVVAVWLHHRLAGGEGPRPGGARRPAAFLGSTLGLLSAGAASLAVFVACTPSLLVYPGQAFSGGRGIFFGVRQYAGGGWIGVQPDSNVLFYARLVVHELGVPAAVLALAGLASLAVSPPGRRVLVRLAWLAPFPAAYLFLICSMSMVVRRNLVPAVPALAAFAGVGVVAAWVAARRLVRRVRRGSPPGGAAGEPRRRWLVPGAAVLLAALVLQPPAARSVADSVAMAQPSTRELARAWLLENAPPGSAVVRESYGPELPPERFAVWKSRFAAHFSLADLRAADVDHLVLVSAAYARFLDPERHAREHHEAYGDWYRRVFAELPLAAELVPDRLTWGPVIRIYRLPAEEFLGSAVTLPARDFFLPDGGMRGRGAAAEGTVEWFRPGQWALAKVDLAAGIWRLELDPAERRPREGPVAGEGGEPRLRLLLAGRPPAEAEEIPLGGPGGDGPGRGGVGQGGARPDSARFEIPEPARAYLYLYLPVGSRLQAVRLYPEGTGLDGVVPENGTGFARPSN